MTRKIVLLVSALLCSILITASCCENAWADTLSGKKIVFPVSGTVSQWYHFEGSSYHTAGQGWVGFSPFKISDMYALDLSGSGCSGLDVRPIADGKVAFYNSKMGYVVVKHENVPITTTSAVVNKFVEGKTWYSGYMHMANVKVDVGELVTTETVLGSLSNVGVSAIHLHFAVYDSDMKSFSPYLLSDVFRESKIEYKADNGINYHYKTNADVLKKYQNILTDVYYGNTHYETYRADTECKDDPEATPPVITTTTESLAKSKYFENTSYTITLEATGTDPIKWFHVSGNLPDGMELKEEGTIEGTPNKEGTFTFTVTAVNNSGPSQADTKELSLTVSKSYTEDEVPKITTTALDEGEKDQTYSQLLSATGRTPITWTASNLPSGLAIDRKTGNISGTPEVSGQFKVKITAKNSDIPEKGKKTFTLNINEKPSITTDTTLTPGYTHTKYPGVTLTAAGYPKPTWKVAALSALPPGLELNPETGEITGTPTKTGTYTFKITAKNKLKSVTKKFKIVISVGDPIIRNESLPSGKVGKVYSKQLSSYNISSTTGAWAATSTLPEGLTLSSTGLLSGTPTSAGTYNVYVRAINAKGTYVDKTL